MTNENFKIKFRGVRGSYPVISEKVMKFGGNTSCVEVNVNGHLIILDAGTGIISLGDEISSLLHSESNTQKPKSITILLSHLHQDHIQGLNFFKPINIPNTKISVFGLPTPENDLKTNLSELVWGKSFPVSLIDLPSELQIKDIFENEMIVLEENSDLAVIKKVTTSNEAKDEQDKVTITCMKSNSHPQNGVLVYKIQYNNKTLVYATDKESYIGSDKRMALFARNADLLIHDSQYTSEDYLSLTSSKQGFGHSTYEMAIETAQVSQAKKVVFFHFAPNYNDQKLSEVEKHFILKYPNSIMAKEGLEICL